MAQRRRRRFHRHSTAVVPRRRQLNPPQNFVRWNSNPSYPTHTQFIVSPLSIYQARFHFVLFSFPVMPLSKCPVYGCRAWRRSGLRTHPLPPLSVFSLQLKADTVVSALTRICALCFKRHIGAVTGLKGRVRVRPSSSPLAVVLGADAAPFISLSVVVHGLYAAASPHTGLSHWQLDNSDNPLTAADTTRRPPFFDRLERMVHADNHYMPVVPFNLPDASKSKRGALRTHYEQPSEQVMIDVLSLVREHCARADELTMVVYQKDNERFSAWQKRTGRPVRGAAAVHSPLNPHLFSLDPTNLCSLMPDHSFSGFTSPSWYVKSPGSFFCLHVEQLYAPFYNLCYDGGTTWWVVRREDRGRLDEYVVQRARQCYGVPNDVQLTHVEERAVAGLLTTKQLVFHPDDLTRAGVRMTEVRQVAGSVVVGDGDLVHFGMAMSTSTEQMRSSVKRGRQLHTAAMADDRLAATCDMAAMAA